MTQTEPRTDAYHHAQKFADNSFKVSAAMRKLPFTQYTDKVYMWCFGDQSALITIEGECCHSFDSEEWAMRALEKAILTST